MSLARHRSSWLIAGFSIVVILLFLLGMYRDTFLHVIDVWSQWDGGYSHGYLALAISLYLVFRQRKMLEGLTPCTSMIALFGVAASSLIWLLATLAGVLLVQTAALLLLVISSIWVILGGRLAWHLLVPVSIVALALPVWTPLQPVLQELTATSVYWLTRVFGVPALRLEHVITLPAGQLSINESCSGVSYLLAALILGVLYAYLNYRGVLSRLMVVALAAAAAVLANVLRVFIVVYLAYKTDMQHPLVDDHFNLGWYLFGGLAFVMLLIHAGLTRHSGDVRREDRSRDSGVHTEQCRQGYLPRILVPVVTLVLLAAGPVTARWVLQHPAPVQDVRLEFPQGADDWSGPSVTDDDWLPVYHGAVDDVRTYRKDGHELYLYIGYYPVQGQGREVISDLNSISDGKTWYSSLPPERLNSAASGSVLEQRLVSTAGQRRLVWYWYRVAGQDTANRYMAKVFQLLGLVNGRPEAAVFALAVGLGDDEGPVRQLMGEFLVTMGPSLTGAENGNNE